MPWAGLGSAMVQREIDILEGVSKLLGRKGGEQRKSGKGLPAQKVPHDRQAQSLSHAKKLSTFTTDEILRTDAFAPSR